MENHLFEEIDKLGFGRAMKQQIKLRIDVAGPHFGASEHRKILGYDVKLLATLSHDRKQHTLLVRSYDVVDLTIRRPEYRRPEIISLDKTMALVDWDSPHFAWRHQLNGQKDDAFMYTIANINEDLKNLAVRDLEYYTDVERLRLKYMYDSLYGIRHSLDGTQGDKYNQYFSMLSINRKTGLCPVRDAVFLLCRCNLNNYQPPEVVKAAVDTRLQRAHRRHQHTHREVIAATTTTLRNAV